jgi:replicative DNA helicase
MLRHQDFKSSLDVIQKEEKQIREDLVRNKLKFGISFLDESLRGILPTDLVLIGASSGVGKTELASNIAYKNAHDGKRVYGIFLEAFRGEIELRQKYRLLATEAKKDGRRPNYADWIHGEQPWLDEYSKRIDYSTFQNVFTKYRDKQYTVEDLEKDLLSINTDADLIVIDHLHYFDIQDENENRGMTRILKTIADIIQVIQRPVILVSHIRKRGDFDQSLVPDKEDLHGSSNIHKIATKVVTMANASFTVDHSFTFMKAAKYRLDGSVTNYIANCKYSPEMNDYEKRYLIGRAITSGRSEKWEECAEKPRWYKGGMDDSKRAKESTF